MKVEKYSVVVNEDRCLGYKNCTLCVDVCKKGVLIPNEKTGKIMVDKNREQYCTGLGSCVNVCPTNALKIVNISTEINKNDSVDDDICKHFSEFKVVGVRKKLLPDKNKKSYLNNWPIQLRLLNENADCFKNSHLAIVGDCVPFAHGDFHKKFLRGKIVAVACPRLDNTKNYTKRIRDVVKSNNIVNVDIVIMETPCCKGLYDIVKEALRGLNCNITTYVVSIRGEVIKETKE